VRALAGGRIATGACLLGAAVVLGVALAAPGALAAAHLRSAGKPNPVADPAHNATPSSAFWSACYGMGTSVAANRACDKPALVDFDKVRKSEGLGKLTLPGDFNELSVRAQLLAITDIERVDRHRRPVLGLSKPLDTLARQGAKADRDPYFPSHGFSSGGSNWAGAGNSALLDDFFWMYDDGPNSGNEDCQHKGDPGCWGHRHNIINAYSPRLVMGAAVAYKTGTGTSMTEEFLGGDTAHKVNVKPTWATIAATFPLAVTVSSSSSSVAAGKAVTITGRVTHKVARIGAGHQRVALERRIGAGSWSTMVKASTGRHGVVHLALHPAKTAAYRVVALGAHGHHLATSAPVTVTVSG